MGTNAGLIKLALSDNLESATFRLYTTVDGLQDNIFIRSAQAVAADGEMFFGGHRGYNSFYPENQQEQPFSSSVIVTDIKIFNQSWGNLPAKERMEISELSPASFISSDRKSTRLNSSHASKSRMPSSA